MPTGVLRSFRRYFTLLIYLFISGNLIAQIPPESVSTRPSYIQHQSTLSDDIAHESDCNNGVDDNGNGLTDSKDFHCYFTNERTMEDCTPSNIIWASTNWGLHWIDLETNEQKLIYSRNSYTFDDLTWNANGKLYGANRVGGIYEIDPYTTDSRFIGDVEGHYYSNGMTGDAQGMLYLTAFTVEGTCNVVRMNVATLESEIIVNLTANELRSAGDLCFLNGFLYVSCESNYIAKINVNTGKLEKKVVTGLPVTASFGMITLGDGYLYMSDNNNGIYRVDPDNMTAVHYKDIDHPFLTVLGLTSYPDLCNSPVCKGNVSISTNKFPPYCVSEGVMLSAEGTGIKGESSYTWTLPGESIVTGNTLLAKEKGKYYVKYYSETCTITDSIVLDIADVPVVDLGADSFICDSSTIQISPSLKGMVSNIIWDDGSNEKIRTINQPGSYWIEASNVCGLASDTIIITEQHRANVFIGNDTMLCKYDAVSLMNMAGSSSILGYKWNDGSHNEQLIASKPGIYILEASTHCGIVTDTLIINQKIDDCECFLYVPNAFSPNNDNRNDVFGIESNCAVKGTISIFNRWGGLIYSSNDISRGWNGYMGSNGQPAGLYVYHIRYEYINRPGEYIKKGTITLIH